MRPASWLAVGMVLVGTCASAKGQYFGIDPTTIQYKVINTDQAIAPVPLQQRPTTFQLKNLLPRFLFNFGKPVVGQSNFPSPKEMLQSVGYYNPYRKN